MTESQASRMLSRLDHMNEWMDDLGPWVVTASVGLGVIAGLLLVQIILRAKDSKHVW